MQQLPKLNCDNLLVQFVATVLRETLHHRGIYEETIANACETCGSLPDEWGFCECVIGQG